MSYRTGFIGIVGPTNSGKSTLLNAMMGKKLSIVSPRVQTTLHGIRGVLTSEKRQMVLTDTPGFQKHGDRMAILLNRVAENNARDCDVLAWVFDASSPRVIGHIDNLKPKISALGAPEKSLCVLNKVDLVAKPALLPLIQHVFEMGIFGEIVPVSARTGDGLDRLSSLFEGKLPEGEKLYPEEMVTDRPQPFRFSEAIREKIYQATRQELPYSVWIQIEESYGEQWDTTSVPTIRAIIHVDSPSRKAILIGKGGLMLKRIGMAARKDIEAIVGHQICLKLHVDVQNEWKSDSHQLSRYLELDQ